MSYFKKFTKVAVALAIVFGVIGIHPDVASATPMGTTQSQAVGIGEGGGTIVEYGCVVIDPDPTTVTMSLDDCHLENANHVKIDDAPAPLVVPGNTATTATLTTTSLASPTDYYVCWTATSLHEFAPRQTVGPVCELWSM